MKKKNLHSCTAIELWEVGHLVIFRDHSAKSGLVDRWPCYY